MGLDKSDLLSALATANKAVAENIQYAQWLEQRDAKIAELEKQVKELTPVIPTGEALPE
jgi:hypothetical protein